MDENNEMPPPQKRRKKSMNQCRRATSRNCVLLIRIFAIPINIFSRKARIVELEEELERVKEENEDLKQTHGQFGPTTPPPHITDFKIGKQTNLNVQTECSNFRKYKQV